MSAARMFIVSCLAVAAACATTRPAQSPARVEELEATVTNLRAQNAGYVKQIEELQNKIFILEDKLDSHNVAADRRSAPRLPSVDLAPAQAPAVAELPESLQQTSESVEYAGDAAHSIGTRPVLRLTGNDGAREGREVAVAATPVSKRTNAAKARRSKAATPVRAKQGALPAAAAAAAAPVPAPPVPQGTPAALAPKPDPAPAPAVAEAQSPVKPVAPSALAPASKPAASVAARGAVRAAPEPDAAPAPVASEPLRAYRSALELLRAGKHTEALLAFRQFIDRNPGHDYADNAQYWVGECYYDQKDYRAAVREFRGLVVRFPHGNKVPDAMLKMAFSHLELKESEAAREVLQELIKSYPHHPSSSLAQARLANLGGQASAHAKTGAEEARR